MGSLLKSLFKTKKENFVLPKEAPDPEHLFEELPLAIRAEELECYAAGILGLNDEKREEEFIESLRKNPEQTARKFAVLEAIAEVYKDQSRKITRSLQLQLDEANKREKSGDINGAVKIYEELLRHNFLGTFPYDRLRIIYAKQHQYAEALRVCLSFIIMKKKYSKHNRPSDKQLITEFTEWTNKYKAKIE